MGKKLKIAIGIIITSFILICIPYFVLYITFPDRLFESDYSKVILDENNEILRVFTNSKEQWHFPMRDEKKIPEKLIEAVVLFEDKEFFDHNGISLKAIIRAAYLNVKYRKKVSGASTLTMQLSRLMKPKKRTYVNKIIEMYTALLIENKYSKKEILNMYFTHAPYGGNIVGYRTASLKYFDKMPEHLTWAEAALLAVLPNSPGLIHPRRNTNQLKKKRNDLLKNLLGNGKIDENIYKMGLKEPLPKKVYTFDFLAPHLSRKIAHERDGFINQTTISKKMQKNLEVLSKTYMKKLKRIGINNCAVLVVDTNTSEIKSYIGSNDFFDFKNHGQVDGVTAKRSPGSTLKPFLYALAIDKGLIHPRSLLKDVPSYFGVFSPQNADRKFRGMVSVKEALVKSLNVPAVNLLQEYGVGNFYNFLEESEVRLESNNPKKYGYSMILGSLDLSLYEITKLYTMLGNEGNIKEMKYMKESNKKKKKALLSTGSTYMVLDMLKDLKRPGIEYYWKEFGRQKYLAWKTGTSFGRRDAWAMGVSPKYTIGVWVGNFNGKGAYNLSGIESAGTLLFQIYNNLDVQGESFFDYPNNEMRKIDIDSETGFALPYAEMKNKIKVDFPKDAKMLKKSPYYKTIFHDKEGEYEVCSRCWDAKTKVKKITLVYPPALASFYEEKGIYKYSALKHNPKCDAAKENDNLKIVYPKDKTVLVVPRGNDGKYKKINIKTTQNKGKLFWFIDGKLHKETLDTAALNLLIESGKKEIAVMNEYGDKHKINIKVIKNIKN